MKELQLRTYRIANCIRDEGQMEKASAPCRANYNSIMSAWLEYFTGCGWDWFTLNHKRIIGCPEIIILPLDKWAPTREWGCALLRRVPNWRVRWSAQNSWSTSFTPVQYHGRIWLYDLLGWWSSGKKIEREKSAWSIARNCAHRFYTVLFARARQ